MMFRALAPTAVPIRFYDICAGIYAIFSGSRAVFRFKQEICHYFGVRYATPVSSGRAGLSLILRVLYKRNPVRPEVLIPAFTSYSVPSAVINAGLKISLYDIDPITLSPVYESLVSAITDKTLCIVVCHLFGYPADLDLVLKVADQRQIPVIDDAAQAMGARYNGKLVGTFGIAGLFSLGKGKNISAVDGGIVVSNDDALAKELSEIDLDKVMPMGYLLLIVKAVALTFILHPRCFWFPLNFSSLGIVPPVVAPKFALQRFTAFQAGIALRMLKRLKVISDGRLKIAQWLLKRLSENHGIVFPRAVAGAEPVFLRFPVLLPGTVEMPELGLVRPYPVPIHQAQGVESYLSTDQNFPGARMLAERTVTLPTHCFVTESDCAKAIKVIS